MAKRGRKTNKKPNGTGEDGDRNKQNGQFVKGHKNYNPGNNHPTQKKSQELKEALLAAISPVDIQSIVKKLITKAKAGDVYAAKEVFDRCFGKAMQPLDIGNINLTLTDIAAQMGANGSD